MNKRKTAAALCLALALAALMALSACSQPAQSSKGEDKMEANEASVAESSAPQLKTEPFYVLIVGNDTREGTVEITKPEYADGNARSDTMMLTRVDPVSHQLTLVTVPRDTRDVVDGDVRKLNDRYRYGGMSSLLDGVEQLTGIRPDYYVNTTFVGFQDIIDKMGGITMYVPVDQSMQDIVGGEQIYLSAGEQTLDGAQALVFARERHAYGANQEALRQANDRMIMKTIMQTILADSTNAGNLVKAVYGFVDSDMDADLLAAYVEDFAEHAGEVVYLDGTGPYEGGTDAESGKWLTYRDEDTWRAIMAAVDAGGDPNEVFSGPSLY